MDQKKTHLHKNDTVVILSGKDRDRRGKVLRVEPKTGKLVVEGLNMAKKHSKPSKGSPQGGVIDIPMPLPVSKVMLVCPSCNQPTRLHREIVNGKAVRVCKNCRHTIEPTIR